MSKTKQPKTVLLPLTNGTKKRFERTRIKEVTTQGQLFSKTDVTIIFLDTGTFYYIALSLDAAKERIYEAKKGK